MTEDERLMSDRFPHASGYNPEWVLAGVSGGANPLWLTEWLSEALDLRSGMRVLDLGCGRAVSSIFLHREFGVQVWATDLWFSATESIRRVRDAAIEDGVIPIRAEARLLPFSEEFFDAVVSIDSFMYYGTDDLHLNYLAGFVKPGRSVGIALAGFMGRLTAIYPATWPSGGPRKCRIVCTQPTGGGGIGNAVVSWTMWLPTLRQMAGGSGGTGSSLSPLRMKWRSRRWKRTPASTLATSGR